MGSDLRILVIVPAWNEELSVAGVVKEVLATTPADVVVVDDGSRDATSAAAREAGATVLRLPYNLGVGGAMRLGYRYARDNDYDVAVQIDADGQHDPATIPQMVQVLEQGFDLVIGARFAGEGDYQVRGPRRWAMKLLSAVLSRLAGTRLTDTTSGYRVCGRELIAVFAERYPVEYLGDTVETLTVACRSGFRVTQVPVAMRRRVAGRASHSPLRAGIYLGRAVLALGLALARR